MIRDVLAGIALWVGLYGALVLAYGFSATVTCFCTALSEAMARVLIV